jgi:hypothetical protein
MNDFSIEASAERIVDIRSRGYFAEVYGSYAAGHYRSAVVMLWSVVITDILFKLDQLQNAYADPTAKAILSEIDSLRRGNPKSPEWEGELINKVASRTDLLDTAELTFLTSLQSHRHLSAHPVLSDNEVLFSPNKETTRAHIRNILDSVLTKPPIMSRRIFDAFIEDVEQISQLVIERDKLHRYLKAKYFKHFSLATFIHVFRSLWRVTFKSLEPRCESNRQINEQALEVLFIDRANDLLKAIEDNPDWYSDVSFQEGSMVAMMQFFRQNPRAYLLMTDAVKTPMLEYASQSIDGLAEAWFTDDSPESALEAITGLIMEGTQIRPTSYKVFCESMKATDCYLNALELGITFLGRSGSYEAANMRFEYMILPFLSDYNIDLLSKLLAAIEGNGQVLERRRAGQDNMAAKDRIDEIDPNFDFSNFPRFIATL